MEDMKYKENPVMQAVFWVVEETGKFSKAGFDLVKAPKGFTINKNGNCLYAEETFEAAFKLLVDLTTERNT